RKGYEKLIKEWTALGDSYEEEFKKLLSAGQRSRYTEYRKRFVNSHGLMLFGYGDFYDAGFLQKHEVELTPKQKETLRQINRTYINEMLGHEKPGERTAVYMEYEKALKDMFDEEQWYYYLHKFDGFRMPRPKTGAGGKK
ncbi:MAG: hypothetical protein ILO36_01495, partial [Abditibacteriota bacterium]|nr:hypothetical protein [Abditibacteriota bacterium]